MRRVRPVSLLVFVLFAGVLAPTGNAQFKIAQPGLPPTPFVPNNNIVFSDDKLPEHAAIRLGTTRLRVGDYLRAAQFTRDGKHIVAVTSNRLLLFDAATGKLVRQLNRSYINFQYIDVSFDGKLAAMTSYGNYIQILDTTTGKPVRTLKTANVQHRLQHVIFSPDGKLVAGCPYDYYNNRVPVDRGVFVWNVKDGKQYGPFQVIHTRQVRATFSRDSKVLATFGGVNYATPQQQKDAHTIQLWDVTGGKEIRKLEGMPVNITAVAFSADGKKLAAVTGRSTVSVWDVKTGKLLRRFAGRAASNAFVEFSPDDKYLTVGNSSGMVQMWDTKTWKRLDARGPACRATSVAFIGKDKVVACGIDGQAVRVWNVRTGKSLTPGEGHNHYLKAVEFSRDSKQVISIDQSGKICWWDPVKGDEIRHTYIQVLNGSGGSYDGSYSQSYYTLALSPNNKYIAAYYGNGVRLWHLPTGRVLCDFESGTNSSQTTIAFSAKSDKVAIVNSDASVSVWNIHSGEELHHMEMHKGAANTSIHSARAVFSPRGDRLAASCYYYDQGIRRSVYVACLYDLKTGREIARLDLPNGTSVMDFSPDGSRLAIGSSRGIGLYNAVNGKEVRQFNGNFGSFATLAFAPDGRTLAAAVQTYTGTTTIPTIYVWEVATGRIRSVFRQGHAGQVVALTYSPNGKYLASGSNDTSIVLWDLSGRHGPKVANPPQKVQALWNDLGNVDSANAFKVMVQMLATSDKTVAFLKKNLQPAKGAVLTRKEIQKLIADLDSSRFAIRERANDRLQKLGKAAWPELKAALKEPASLEMEQRLVRLVERLERQSLDTNDLREVRAVEVLERIGTPQARQLLAHLASGAPGALLTEHSQGALERLKLVQ